MKGTAGCLAEGSKLQIFVSFRVFRTESQYFYESNAVGLCARSLHIKETTLLLSYTEWRICNITKKETSLFLFEKTRVLFVILDNHSPCLVCQMNHKWKLRIVATINVSWNVSLTKFKCFNQHSVAVNSKIEVSPCWNFVLLEDFKFTFNSPKNSSPRRQLLLPITFLS